MTSPVANLVRRIGLMTFDAVGEARHLVGAIVDRKGPCGVLEIEVGGAWPPQPGEGRRSGGVIALPMMRSSNAAVRVTTVASVIIGRASRWELAKGGQVFEAKTWSCRNRIR